MEELKQSVKTRILEAVRARRHGLKITPEEELLIEQHVEMIPVEHTKIMLLIEQCLELIPVERAKIAEVERGTEQASFEPTSNPPS